MNIIFVCTGNTCRSPMAEYYLKSKNLSHVNVVSRGFSAGEPANPNSIAAMNEAGIDISNHTSSCITAEEAKWADKIICMTESHKQLLISSGIDKDQISVLLCGIADPFGCDIDTYRKCRDSIFDGIDALVQNGFFGEIKMTTATNDDIARIATIEKECFSTPWSENAIRESMQSTTTFYVAQIGCTVVGYMGLSKVAGEGYVTNVAVLNPFRRMGIGKHLLQYVINDNSSQLEFISLEVRISNNAAISLYEKLGFKRVGLRKRFYQNPQEDAIIMTKSFI